MTSQYHLWLNLLTEFLCEFTQDKNLPFWLGLSTAKLHKQDFTAGQNHAITQKEKLIHNKTLPLIGMSITAFHYTNFA